MYVCATLFFSWIKDNDSKTQTSVRSSVTYAVPTKSTDMCMKNKSCEAMYIFGNVYIYACIYIFTILFWYIYFPYTHMQIHTVGSLCIYICMHTCVFMRVYRNRLKSMYAYTTLLYILQKIKMPYMYHMCKLFVDITTRDEYLF